MKSLSPSSTVAVIAGLHLVGSAWLLGGYYSGSIWFMAITGWGALAVAVVALIRNSKLREGNPAWNFVWLLWLGLLLLLAISLLNPSYQAIENGEVVQYLFRAHLEWIPSVVDQGQSFLMIAQFSGSLALCWSVLALVRSRVSIRKILMVCAVNAFALAMVGSLLKITGAENPLNYFRAVNSSFFASFSYHNHWVAYAAITLSATIGLFLHAYRKRAYDRRYQNRCFILGFIGFFLLVSFLLVESRVGLLVLMVFMVSIPGSLWFRRGRQRENLFRKALVIAGILFAFGYYGYKVSEKQIDRVSDKYEESWSALWRAESEVDKFRFNDGPKISIEMIERKPVWGWGFGSYQYASRIYAPKYLGQGVSAQYAHCDWLQFVAELGVVGFTLLVLPVIAVLRKGRRKDVISNWILFGLLVLSALAVFEFPFSNPSVLAHACVLLALLIGLRARESRDRNGLPMYPEAKDDAI